MDDITELEATLEAAAHDLARQRHRDTDAYAGLTIAYGAEDAARVWLRASLLWRQGLEEEAAA